MSPLSLLPIAGPEEVEAFLGRIPLAVDRSRFAALVRGFPRRYLETTPGLEVVRHYALMNSMGTRSIVSSLARDADVWRICVVASDRAFLFARIAGSLSCFGLNIVRAEAFANTNSLVLDTFSVVDRERHFETPEARRRFQTFLEGVVTGAIDLEARLRERLPELTLPPGHALEVELDDESHPAATRLRIATHDSLGLLFLISRALSEAGCNIEMAYVDTAAETARDAFFLTREGRKLSPAEKEQVRDRLCRLAGRA